MFIVSVNAKPNSGYSYHTHLRCRHAVKLEAYKRRQIVRDDKKRSEYVHCLECIRLENQ